MPGNYESGEKSCINSNKIFLYAKLLGHAGIDAVIVATPPFLHREHAAAAAESGRHVFLEKPMAPSVADCDAIIETTNRAGVTLMVGQVLRYIGCWERLLELVRSGTIGNVFEATMTRLGAISGRWEKDWRWTRKLSGGLLMEINAHEFDFLCEVAGEPVSVTAQGGTFADARFDHPNVNHVMIRFAGGALGFLHSGTHTQLAEQSCRVEGDKGSLAYHGWLGTKGEIRLATSGNSETVDWSNSPDADPVARKLTYFTEAIRGRFAPPVPGWQGRRAVAVAEAAYRSMETGASVELPPPVRSA